MNKRLTRYFLLFSSSVLILAMIAIACSPQFATLTNLTLIALNIGIIAWLHMKPSNRYEGTALFTLSWALFPLLKPIAVTLIPWTADTLLHTIDRHLWGGQPLPAYFQFETHTTLANLFFICYFLFYLQVIGAVLYYTIRPRPDFFNRLMCGYLIGFIGYFILPAAGPAFTTLPHGNISGSIAALLSRIVAEGVTGMDVFPSLHTAISIFITAYLWRDGKTTVATILTPITIGIICATIYLRYHYGIDVLIGIVLATYLIIKKEKP